jgi:hypothetical protein
VENKLESQTQDLAGYNNFQTPNLGAPNYSLHTDGAGNTYWDPDATGSGIQYTGTTPIPVGTHVKINTTDGNTAIESNLEESATEIKVNGGLDLDMNSGDIRNCPLLFSGGPMTLECGGGGDLSLISGTFGGDLKLSAPGGLISVLTNTSMNNLNIANANEITKTAPGNLELKHNNGAVVVSGQGLLGNIQLQTPNNIIASCNLFESFAALNDYQGNINMNSNQILNPSLISTSSNLDINATADLNLQSQSTIELKSAVGTELATSLDLVKVSNSLQINGDKVIYVPDGKMPSSYSSDTTYVFLGSRSTANQIDLTGLSSVTIMGMSRDSSTIEYTGASTLITTVDEDFTLSNLRIKSSDAAALVLDAKNVSKNKLLTIQNCEFRNCKNLFDITGYDLCDIEQNIFTFIEGGSSLVPPRGVYTTDVSKLQLTSCEFIRWFQEGGTPSTTEFNGDMVFIQGTCGAHNITNNVFHPQFDQNGIVIDGSATFVEVAINTNQFVDVNLNKPTFSILNTNSNADFDTEGIQEGNSLLPNLKSRLGMSYYTATPPTTTLTTINIPVNMVFTTGIINPFDTFGITVDTTTNIGRITYNRKRPVNFQITGTFEVLFTSGSPTTQNVGITLAKNGASLFGAGIVSYQTLATAGTDPKQYTFAVIGSAEQNDYFEFQLVSNNLAGSSDFEIRSFLISGIEI